MSREKEGFRDQLVALRERFGDRESISINEAAAVCNISADTIRRNAKADKFPAKQIGARWVIPIIGLARWLAF